MHDGLRAVSRVPYFGMDIIGAWGAPAYSKFLQGASPHLDGAFLTLTQWWQLSPQEFLSRYQYITRYLGDKPFMTFNALYAQADSSMSCFVLPPAPTNPLNLPSQEIRGQTWFNDVQYLLY